MVSFNYFPQKADCLNGDSHIFREWRRGWAETGETIAEIRYCNSCGKREKRIVQKKINSFNLTNKVMIKETKFIEPVVIMKSLVGVSAVNFPLTFGNYFYMGRSDELYIINCWSENLREWTRINPNVNTIEVTVLSDDGKSVGIITDERMKDWVNEKPCVTGHGWPSDAVKNEATSIIEKTGSI